MDCHTFRANHLAFVDDTLNEQGLVAMQRHLAECAACTRHDISVRRGLMVLHSLPPIEPSRDFSTRLASRLRDERLAAERAAVARRRVDPLIRTPRYAPFAAVAASVALIGVVAFGATAYREAERSILANAIAADGVLPPVVTSTPAFDPSPAASSMFLAGTSTGVALWSAALLVEQAPAHFVTAEMRR